MFQVFRQSTYDLPVFAGLCVCVYVCVYLCTCVFCCVFVCSMCIYKRMNILNTQKTQRFTHIKTKNTPTSTHKHTHTHRGNSSNGLFSALHSPFSVHIGSIFLYKGRTWEYYICSVSTFITVMTLYIHTHTPTYRHTHIHTYIYAYYSIST